MKHVTVTRSDPNTLMSIAHAPAAWSISDQASGVGRPGADCHFDMASAVPDVAKLRFRG